MPQKKKLEPGVTKIGSVQAKSPDGRAAQYDVYFGNKVYPLVKGRMRSLPRKSYDKLLVDFMQNGGNDLYYPPTDEECEAAIAIVAKQEKMRLEAVKKNKEAEEAAERQKLYEQQKAQEEKAAAEAAEAKRKAEADAKAAEEARINAKAQEMARQMFAQQMAQQQAQTQQMYTAPSSPKAQAQPEQARPEQAQPEPEPTYGDYDNDDDDTDSDEDISYTAKPVESRSAKGTLVLVAAALLLSLLGNAYMFFRFIVSGNQSTASSNTASSSSKKTAEDSKLVSFEVNGEKYKINIDTAELSKDDTKLTIYGIASENDNGKIKHAVIPLGVVDLKDVKFESSEPAKAESSASPDASASSDTSNGTANSQ